MVCWLYHFNECGEKNHLWWKIQNIYKNRQNSIMKTCITHHFLQHVSIFCTSSFIHSLLILFLKILKRNPDIMSSVNISVFHFNQYNVLTNKKINIATMPHYHIKSPNNSLISSTYVKLFLTISKITFIIVFFESGSK